jgi:hypothetical protein
MPSKPKPIDWQRVLAALPQAPEDDLLKLRLEIDRVLLDPHRIATIRARLAVGQTVEYLSERQSRLNSGRVVELTSDRVLIETDDGLLRWLHYAAIRLDAPPDDRSRAFAVGDRVGFEDKTLKHRFGVIKRINRITATVTSEGADVRVPFAALGRVVDL